MRTSPLNRPHLLLFVLLVSAGSFATGAAKADRPAPFSAQTITAPSGPTSIHGLGESFSPNIAMGTGNYSVPIAVPPGLLTPKISLDYSGGIGRTELGVGFQLPVLNIYRMTDKGLPGTPGNHETEPTYHFKETDRFAVSGPTFNDELVSVNSEEGYYRLKNEGSFALFIRNKFQDTWTIKLSNGHTLELGYTGDSRQTAGPRGTFKWFISRHADQFDHEILYTYESDIPSTYDIRLREIHYQTHAEEAHQNRVIFRYMTRRDSFTNYRYGVPITTNKLLDYIEVKHGPDTVRSYDLDYERRQVSSVLTSVKMTGKNKESLPALSFDYVRMRPGGNRLKSMTKKPPLEPFVTGNGTLEDVTGDGLPDVVIVDEKGVRYYENYRGLTWRSARWVNDFKDFRLSDPNTMLVDVNGDGFRDLVRSSTSPRGVVYAPGGHIEKGVFKGFDEPEFLDAGMTPGVEWGRPELRLTDLNHDGRIDLLSQSGRSFKQILNVKGSNGEKLVERNIPSLPIDVDLGDPRIHLSDFNGDGLLDIVFKHMSMYESASYIKVWYGRGFGLFEKRYTQMGNVPAGDNAEFYFADINRDGRVDLIQITGSLIRYYLNLGTQFGAGAKMENIGIPYSHKVDRIFFADMNGNGTQDVVWINAGAGSQFMAYMDLFASPHYGLLSKIDNGLGKVSTIQYRSSTDYATDPRYVWDKWETVMPTPVSVISEIRTTDSFDKLGFTPIETVTQFEYRHGFFDTVEREFRGFAEVTSTELGDDIASNVDVHHPSLVKQTWFHVGTDLETGEDQEILKGKAYRQVTRNLNGEIITSVETSWEQTWLCADEGDELQDILPDCSVIDSRDDFKDHAVAFAANNDVLKGSWEKTRHPRYTYKRMEYDRFGNATRTEDFGEVVFCGGRQIGDPFYRDLMDTNCDHGYRDDEVIQVAEYINNLNPKAWLIGIPYLTEVRDSAENIVALSGVYYDGTDRLGEATNGLPTRTVAWKGGPFCKVDHTNAGDILGSPECTINRKRSAYNLDGLPMAQKDANGNLVEYEYDKDTGALPSLERIYTDWAGNDFVEVSATYFSDFGVIHTVTDFNNQTTTIDYDGLGRIQEIHAPLTENEIQAGVNLDLPTAAYEYHHGTSTTPVSTTITKALVNRKDGIYRTSWQYSDGFGTGRLTKTQAEGSFGPFGYIASGWEDKTARGLTMNAYDSFPSKKLGLEAASSSGTSRTETYYDEMGRSKRVYPPATAEYGRTFVKTEHRPFETHVYDERDAAEGLSDDENDPNKQKYPAITKVDGQGRVRRIIKHNDVEGKYTPLVWNVEYNPLGSITGFIDPQGNKRVYGYDILQRMTSVSDLNVGRIEYTYDDVGNLLRRIDALGQIQEFDYGPANRLTAAHMKYDAHGAADYGYFYHYDTPAAPLAHATNLRGKLARVEWPTGTHHVSYDERGRLVEEAQTLWDGASPVDLVHQKRDTFTQSYDYDTAGNVISQTAPGGLHLGFQYNERSLLTGVFGGLSVDEQQRGIFTGMTYDHRGAILRTDMRNGTSTRAWYDNRARLEAVMSGPGETIGATTNFEKTNQAAFQQLVYKRTPNGLLKEIQDLTMEKLDIPGFGAGYEYDRLYQLTKATTAEGIIGFSYDTIQNLVRRTLPEHPDPIFKNLLSGDFGYGKKVGDKIVGPNQITSAGDKTFEYNAIGQMKEYNGFTLKFDVEGRLVEAVKANCATLKYYYDDTGEKKLTIIKRPGKPDKIYRYVSGGFQIRDGKETWFAKGGQGQVEITKADGLEVNLALLDEFADYLEDPENSKKPVPVEYLDLNQDGRIDQADYDLAEEGYWTETKVAEGAEVWRYYHKDHLGGSTIVTDSMGDVVSTMRYHPYGKTAQKTGQKPVYGFAGGEIEEEEQLGLIRFGARWYAPGIGRWVSGDVLYIERATKNRESPLNSSLYLYCFNNPLNFTDPNGEDPPAETSYQSIDDGLDIEIADPMLASSTNPELSRLKRREARRAEWKSENRFTSTGKYNQTGTHIEMKNSLGKTIYYPSQTVLGNVGFGNKKTGLVATEKVFKETKVRIETRQSMTQLAEGGAAGNLTNTAMRAGGYSDEQAYYGGEMANTVGQLTGMKAGKDESTRYQDANVASKLPRTDAINTKTMTTVKVTQKPDPKPVYFDPPWRKEFRAPNHNRWVPPPLK